MIPVLNTERLVLRAPEARDFNAYAAYYDSPRTRHTGGPQSRDQAFERFCTLIGHWTLRGFGRFVIERKDTGLGIGHVGPLQISDDAVPELTWTIWQDQDARQGFALEAARAVNRYVFDELAWAKAHVLVEEGNIASQALAEKLGARQMTQAQRVGLRYPHAVGFVISAERALR